MDFGLLFRNRRIFVAFELEQVEFGILTPGIPLSEKSQKECGLSFMDFHTTLERICDFQFTYIIWFLVVYLTYFMKPVKETTFSSKIHKAFFANIRNDCVFSIIKNKQHSYAIRV